MLLNGGQVLAERAKISARLEAWIDSDTGERLSFAEANARTNQLAHVLLARGLAAGDRVGVLMGNTPLHASAYFACAKAGFVFVALNWRLTVAELAYQLADSGASAVLYGTDLAPLVEPLREQYPHIRWIDLESREAHATRWARPACPTSASRYAWWTRPARTCRPASRAK
jgi:acyl-CoA synthetase (AMP-forming)/AMP-acid ligase II